MVPIARSSGVATAWAIDSGLAPGSEALTWIEGYLRQRRDRQHAQREQARHHDRCGQQ